MDPIQESIKRSNIFENVLIINGGPGTGKTTSLIQRIKFLISDSISEYRPLNFREKQIITDQGWLFLTPNELLKLFLKNSMIEEGLPATNDRVKVWSNHKQELIRNYGLVTVDKKPFLFYISNEGINLYKNNHANIQSLFSNFMRFLTQIQKERLENIIDFDIKDFSWNKTGISIQTYLLENIDSTNIIDYIRLYINLSNIYSKEGEHIRTQLDSQVNDLCAKITVRIRNDINRSYLVQELLNHWGANPSEQDLEDEEIENELDSSIGTNLPMSATNLSFDRDLIRRLKGICIKTSLKLFQKNIKYTPSEERLIKIIPEIGANSEFIKQAEFSSIGEKAFYRKYFMPITKGIESNLLRGIPVAFKSFRKNILNDYNQYCENNLVDDLITKNGNIRIHPDEQAFLISIINSIIKDVIKNFPAQSEEIHHQYFESFRHYCKPILAIDEATDFPIIDHLAMQSLSHPSISAVTLAGDIMQRMTKTGINSWSELTALWPGAVVADLNVSYRQSPTLLALASKLYRESTGLVPFYKPFMEQDPAEPKPLLFISPEEEAKINWIADRLMEIYKAYGNSIPSIAIFVSNEDYVGRFAKSLSENDDLHDVGISIKPCSGGEVLGDTNTVRIFSLSVIKGLEFEAVFFHNIDDLFENQIDSDLLLKSMYVGLSRATFYFGMTSRGSLPQEIDFLLQNFNHDVNNWAFNQ